MLISGRWKSLLKWILLSVGIGLMLAVLAAIFLPNEFPFLSSIDMGFAGIVFGMSIKNPSIVAFLLGFLVTFFVLAVRYWDRRYISQAHTMYADYLQNERENRRNFMRRLDHEIKNPLTGLRAALVNLKEEKTDEERQRAVGNANRAVERLIRLLTDLRKLSDL